MNNLHKIKLPNNVAIKVTNEAIQIKGPLGYVIKKKSKNLNIYQQQDMLYVYSNINIKVLNNFLNLLKNIIIGVSQGYSKKLKIVGVEFKVNIDGNKLILRLGFSHEIIYNIPPNIQIFNPKSNTLVIIGYNKQIVSQIAAEIRNLKLPEPYKGKGILYFNEQLNQKEGKKT